LPADIILTNHPFLPSFMTALEDKQFMYVDSEDDFIDLVPRLRANDIDRFALITVEGMELHPPAELTGVQQIGPVLYKIE
jgi:hypothetical protein